MHKNPSKLPIMYSTVEVIYENVRVLPYTDCLSGENRFSGKTENLFSPLNLFSPHNQGQYENPHEFYRDSM